MANIHTLNDFNNNNNQNQNSNMMMGYPSMQAGQGDNQPSIFDILFPKEVYKLQTATFAIICLNTFAYVIQLILFYFYYAPNGYSWSCLLLNFGALEVSSVVNHFHYHRLITPLLLHNGFGHLLSNIISIIFVGFYVEYQLQNIINYLLLFLVSGFMGNFLSLFFGYNNISVGISGAVLGICAYYVWNLVINYDRMDRSQKCCFFIFFIIIFMNLFSGLSQNGNIDVYSHIGGFIGGLAMSTILVHRALLDYSFNQSIMKNLFYASIVVLVVLPLTTLVFINLRRYEDIGGYVCGIPTKEVE